MNPTCHGKRNRIMSIRTNWIVWIGAGLLEEGFAFCPGKANEVTGRW
jgi:hypothetical protein